MSRRPIVLLVTALVVSLVGGPAALAHTERQVESPPRPGTWPDAARVQPHVVVCKDESQPTKAQLKEIRGGLKGSTGTARAEWRAKLANWRYNAKLWPQCEFHDIQAAVDSVKGDTDILVMPGEYNERPSWAVKDPGPDNDDGSYSFEAHEKTPNGINLIGIIGKHNITLEGTGLDRSDVLIDAEFQKHVGIRADRADGFIARNFTITHAVEHGLYTIDTDGYLYDDVAGLYSGEYQLFGYASDHGLIENCEAVGGGDSGIYVGGAPLSGRINTIVQNCDVHHNVMGFSGTNSNWVVLRNNDFYDNAAGIVIDAESDHPNHPPNHQHIIGNRIWDNNFNVYSTTSNVKPLGFTRNTIHIPVGTGIVIASFGETLVRGNWIWDNHTIGVGLSSLEVIDKAARSTFNRIVGNWFTEPGGMENPNGVDLFWDGIGEGNCWDSNYGASSTPTNLPACSSLLTDVGLPTLDQPNPQNIAAEAGLVVIDGETGELVCDHTGTQPCPRGPGPKEGDNTREGKEGGGY
jgi:hypothetical protein